MWQLLRIHRNMVLNTRNLLARVITLLVRRIRVLHTLRVYDQIGYAGVAPLSHTGRANLIF
jgi:hypothetical protein